MVILYHLVVLLRFLLTQYFYCLDIIETDFKSGPSHHTISSCDKLPGCLTTLALLDRNMAPQELANTKHRVKCAGAIVIEVQSRHFCHVCRGTCPRRFTRHRSTKTLCRGAGEENPLLQPHLLLWKMGTGNQKCVQKINYILFTKLTKTEVVATVWKNSCLS